MTLHEIRVPRLGWSMEEGTFLGWLKREGEFVRAGEALFELEGEKATQEIESVDAGVLRLGPGSPAPGSVVAVGAVLAHLEGEGNLASGGAEPSTAEPATGHPRSGSSSDTSSENEATRTRRPSDEVDELAKQLGGSSRRYPVTSISAPPSVRRLARGLGLPVSELFGDGASGRVTEALVRDRAASAAAAPGTDSVASPRARRVARELGLDWTGLTGSGRAGRVREADVRAAAAAGRSAAHGLVPGVAGTLAGLAPRRRTIALRMLESQQQTAPVTLTVRADATNLVSLRGQFKATLQEGSGSGSAVPALTDILARLTASVLRAHPAMGSRWDGDRCVALQPAAPISIGLAVDTEAGLLVPVLRDVERQSLLELAEQSRQLVERARSGRLSAAEMSGGDFTITNLGAFGIDAFTPIINLPQTAILGVGAIRREAVVLDDDRIVPRDVLTLSLTFDHRVLDGAPAARFLNDLVRAIENPAACLLR